MELNDKRVLMFVPDFFGYHKAIQKELENRGAKVDLVLENYADAYPMYRFFWIKNKKTREAFTKKKIEKDLSKITEAPDYIFVIRGE